MDASKLEKSIWHQCLTHKQHQTFVSRIVPCVLIFCVFTAWLHFKSASHKLQRQMTILITLIALYGIYGKAVCSKGSTKNPRAEGYHAHATRAQQFHRCEAAERVSHEMWGKLFYFWRQLLKFCLEKLLHFKIEIRKRTRRIERFCMYPFKFVRRQRPRLASDL